MASTRNKNDKGNYKAEESGREHQRLYLLYKNFLNLFLSLQLHHVFTILLH